MAGDSGDMHRQISDFVVADIRVEAQFEQGGDGSRASQRSGVGLTNHLHHRCRLVRQLLVLVDAYEQVAQVVMNRPTFTELRSNVMP